MPSPRRIAIVHEWFTSMRGGERCVEALCEVFPEATLFGLLHVRGSVSPTLEQMHPRTSFVQHLPFSRTHYRYYLPLFPAAVRGFDLREFDCVVTFHHAVAKGVRTRAQTLHVCYCFTPMRYLWDLYDEYFAAGRASLAVRAAMAAVRAPLQRWDLATALHPHHYVASSENVRSRIQAIYHRDSDVIYPPVETGRFTLSTRDEGYFLVAGAQVPYKRVDLAIAAFNRSGDRLVVAGDGPEHRRLRQMAGPTIRFVREVTDDQMRDLYAGCSALVFPGEEDFGIVPVEAMASGKPVIAFGKGGALETVVDRDGIRSGVLFAERTVESLLSALRKFRETAFDPRAIRQFSLRFDRQIYKTMMKEYLLRRWSEFAPESRQRHI